MRVGIHQINYLPWMGYFHKIAMSDKFVLMDEVQLTDSGMMQRNRILNKNGQISYITVAFQKKEYLKKKFNEVELNQNIDWQKRQLNFLYDNYHKFTTWNEVYKIIEPVFEKKYTYLFEVNNEGIRIICDFLEIDSSKFIYQSKLEYDRTAMKSNLVLALCKSVGANVYLSGVGAKGYMDMEAFENNGVQVEYQDFHHPSYKQKYTEQFIPGLSMLDVMFNCGLKETKNIFWQCVNNRLILS